jgi:hypothetical protein
MRKLLAVLLCFTFIFSSCAPSTIINNKWYNNAYGNITPAANNVYFIGNPSSYFNSTYTYYLNTFGWDDVAVSMINAKTPAANSPTWRDYLQMQVPAFSPTQVNVLYFTAQLPHSYKEGTNIEFHIHVVYPDALVGNSTWYISYAWANIGDTFPVASSVTVYDVPSPTTANRHQLIELASSINGTGKQISSVLLCSIQRLGNTIEDNYPSEIYLVSGDFHIIKDTPAGSRTQFTK